MRRQPGLALFIIALVFVALPATLYVRHFHNERTVMCTVTGTDRTATAEAGVSDARVYTADCGTFAVRDLWLRGQWRSADLFGRLHPGQWRLTVVGVRWPWVSEFPTVLDAALRPSMDPAEPAPRTPAPPPPGLVPAGPSTPH